MISIATPTIDGESIAAVTRVLQSGMLAQGPEVKRFEEEFARYLGTRYAVATSSGTSALHLALLALGVGPGDEVITSPFSFIATGNSILFCGAKPVFADIDSDTYNIDPRLIRQKITPKTKAIMPVHLYGQPSDMDGILSLCKEYKLALVEDACQAHGAEYKGRKVGSFGIGCFSFYPTKNMTTGEGGMLTTDDQAIAEKTRMLRNHGQSQRYRHTRLGYNYRMTDVAAAVGIGQLKRLDEFNDKRIENATFLADRISLVKGLRVPAVATHAKHVFHQFTIRVEEDFKLTRDALQKRLNEQGVGSAVYYPVPIHQQPFYVDLGYRDHLPIAERAAREVLSLPVHPRVTAADLQFVVEALQDA